MQALVYIFISLAGLAIAAAAYFGLTFTPIEAVLAGFVGVALAIVMLERALRGRAEARLERGIEDLSRLLSTDAQAGQVLSQRINEMADIKAGERLDALEADVSVFGTVVQQLAESVAALEEQQAKMQMQVAPPQPENDQFQVAIKQKDDIGSDSMLTIQDVQQALSDDRLVFHTQPIVSLPQRHTSAYDLLPRIKLENGEYADATDFMPRKGGEGLVQKIEQLAWEEAFAIVRQARAVGDTISIHVPLSRATLSDPGVTEQIVEKLETARAMAKDINFAISESQWSGFNAMERNALYNVAEKGVGISITNAKSLRMDFAELEASGVTSVRADATRFINQPETYTDFHSADVASYVSRYGVELIVTGVRSEQQILSLLEDGVRFAQGNHIARSEPVPADLAISMVVHQPPKKRARARGRARAAR